MFSVNTVDWDIFASKIFPLVKFLHSLIFVASTRTRICTHSYSARIQIINFRRERSSTKIFNDENFPIYSIPTLLA